MGAGNKKRNKYISRPLEGHSCETDKSPLFTSPWDQGNDRDIADAARETIAHILPIFLAKSIHLRKASNRLCVKFTMAERVRNYF